MLRLFDLKQNVNSHAFKETAFLPKTCKNEGKEEIYRTMTFEHNQL